MEEIQNRAKKIGKANLASIVHEKPTLLLPNKFAFQIVRKDEAVWVYPSYIKNSEVEKHIEEQSTYNIGIVANRPWNSKRMKRGEITFFHMSEVVDIQAFQSALDIYV